MIKFFIVLMAFLSSLILIYQILKIVYAKKSMINTRLDGLSKGSYKTEDNELNQSLFIRIIRPALNEMSKTTLKITPKSIIGTLEKKVISAGKPLNLSVTDWMNVQVFTMLGLPSITIFLGNIMGMDSQIITLLVLFEFSFGMVFPLLVLNSKIRERQKKIRNSLPDVLDLLTVSVEAGLGFDGALAKVVERMPGPLADEFGSVLQEMKIGKAKKESLKNMSERVNIQDLSIFVGSIIQADQFGVSIGNVLRTQSDQMRQKRMQYAQEKAMKAPIKMMFPMILFIFPTIFSVLLGPVIIKAVDMFAK